MNNIFETEQFYSCGALDECSLENLAKQSYQDMDMDSFGFGVSFSGDDTKNQVSQQLQQFGEFGSRDHSYLDNNTPQISSCGDELRKVVYMDSPKSAVIEPEKKGNDLHSSASFEILKKYGSRCRRLNGEKMNFPCYDTEQYQVISALSIETIIQLAAEKFIKSSSQTSNELSTLSHPYPSSILCHSKEDSEGVQLIQNILTCAEKVDKKRYQHAHELLLECERMSSPTGSPVQRLVFYFTEALYEKIDRETGRITPKGLGKKVDDPLMALKSSDATTIAFHQELPISQITKFAGIQAVLDNVAEASKVHFIDFEIRKGLHCTILMQALASKREDRIEHLKITAVGTKSKVSIEETGRRLMSFAQSLGLHFSFHVVVVDDMLDLNENLFELDADEVVAVYAEYTLTHMIGQPGRLEHLMRVMRSLNLCVMFVAEVEANCNSPIFVDRFVEALFFYGAYFESMADCMKNNEKHRYIAESTCFGSSIRNVVAAEGRERKIRHVRISVWRSFLTRFGFEETELSMSSKYQANLVLKNFISGNSFTFDIDGKSLIIGWKGTPQFDCTRVYNDSAVSKSFQQKECNDSSEKADFFGVEVQTAPDIESFCSGIGFFLARDEPMSQHQIYQQQHFKELGNLDDLHLDFVSPPFQSCEDETRKITSIEAMNTELTEPKKRRSYVFPSKSFKILRELRSSRLKLNGESSSTGYEMQSTHANARGPILPAETIIKLAAEKFIQSMSQSGHEISTLNHPYPSLILAQSAEDCKGVQLVQNLLSCAEKVAENQYERAMKFLKECDKMSSSTGTPIQRLVFYFSEALFEKIATETGRIIPKDPEKPVVDPVELVMCTNMSLLIAIHKEHPLSQITKLVGIQAILDNLEEARKVHIVDLNIRSGVQWIILMQALAARNENPIQHLKITAMGTKSKSMLEETGRRLASFAQSLNLKFTFKIVVVEDILDLNHNLFDLDSDESVAVYAAYTLTSMIGSIDRLNHLMRVMKSLNPCVMIVTELEVNCNSPTFIGRFVESLFFLGAFFDSMADCFKNDETSRINIESTWFRLSIRNILAAEGEQRKIRHVSINVWRAFFARFRLVETELSVSSLDQASLGLQRLPCGSSCTLYMDGKCLTLGWKGTPLSSLSAWKFQRDFCWMQES